MIENKKICIIGATSHIARGLIWSFVSQSNNYLYLYARNTGAADDFVRENNLNPERLIIQTFDNFKNKKYDVIINCVGIADPGKQKDAGSEHFVITETFDNMILEYLKDHKETLYINFSSGAVYGTAFDKPVNFNSSAEIHVNEIRVNDYYRISKINSEAKHRALKEYNIVDIRLFSYFSRFIDLNSSFLMTDIIRAIINKTELLTTDVDIVRDYIDPQDLFNLIMLVADKPFNGVLDGYSSSPVRKFEILEAFESEFGLRYQVSKTTDVLQATGSKNIYYSENRKAAESGYFPQIKSLECLIKESKYLASKK